MDSSLGNSNLVKKILRRSLVPHVDFWLLQAVGGGESEDYVRSSPQELAGRVDSLRQERIQGDSCRRRSIYRANYNDSQAIMLSILRGTGFKLKITVVMAYPLVPPRPMT